MSEPTIDELFAILRRFGIDVEQSAARRIELEAVRAFVERVEKRLPDYNTGKGADSWLKAYRVAVYDELARMEQETNAGSNN